MIKQKLKFIKDPYSIEEIYLQNDNSSNNFELVSISSNEKNIFSNNSIESISELLTGINQNECESCSISQLSEKLNVSVFDIIQILQKDNLSSLINKPTFFPNSILNKSQIKLITDFYKKTARKVFKVDKYKLIKKLLILEKAIGINNTTFNDVDCIKKLNSIDEFNIIEWNSNIDINELRSSLVELVFSKKEETIKKLKVKISNLITKKLKIKLNSHENKSNIISLFIHKFYHKDIQEEEYSYKIAA